MPGSNLYKEASRQIHERRRRWRSKRILRLLYERWGDDIKKSLKPGITVELGAGSGNLKGLFSELISTDILFAPWLDTALDAQELPFKDFSLDNLVLLDVLHHLQEPVRLFYEAERTLRPGGRMILLEPYISWASFLVYDLFHHETVQWHRNPLLTNPGRHHKPTMDANQAIPTLMFEKYRQEFMATFPSLRIKRLERRDPLIYPFSGGFHHPTLIPHSLWRPLCCIERLLRPVNRYLAFRLFVVLEKSV
jgi:SAM-dependent methyltransferase